ncbi:MAG: endonuclease III [Oscillospiraceae bacterium]|nr:endonuclease III [Oscillospiraceae bacterium]
MKNNNNINKNTDNRVDIIIDRLKGYYPAADCSLEYRREPYKLLIMARLAAQCTDARVNAVSKDLFKRFGSIEDFADADTEELEKAVFSCGLYKTKAKNIKDMCRMLLEEFDSRVPEEMDDLLKLPGIGRKIANLIRGDIFGKPAIVTDTHCIRISDRLGLCGGTSNPYLTEKRLAEIIPPEESNNFCHRLVLFGREYCKAKNPECGKCFLNDLCGFVKI